ncbi:protein kinase domain-containing protein [Blastococcus sp. SYSU DS0617]
MAEPGRRLLGGRYELGTLLATGGQGQVWRARDTVLSRPVAVKVLRSEFTGDPTFLARFRAEAQHAALVTHRHIAALYDYGELEEPVTGERLAFLVMELVDGESLADLLAREQRLDAPRTLGILRQAADALAAAHAAGLVHRDVKPGNVLVAADGSVKLTDFGIAVSATSAPLTQTGQVVGTAHYLSPEQAAGGRAGPGSDVYALGLVGYECLTGRRAFDGENSVQIALSHLRETPEPLPDDVPEQVRVLVGHAIAQDPARRLPDGAAFRDAIDDVLAGRRLPPLPPDTSPLPTGPLTGRVRRRARVLAPLAALVVGAGIGVGALSLALDPAVPPAAGAGATDAADTVLLVAAEYLGRPAAEVEAELGRLGLGVEQVADPTADDVAGAVTAIGPTGAVERGTLVTLAVAVGRPDVPADDDPVLTDLATPDLATVSEPPAPAPAPGWSPDPVVVPPPAAVGGPVDEAPATEPARAPTSTGGNGNGNGKGNGQGPGGPPTGAGNNNGNGGGNGAARGNAGRGNG